MEDFRICIVSIGTGRDIERRVEAYWKSQGFLYVLETSGFEHLSDKWNHACERTREMEPDAVMVLGSDDLVTRDYVRRVSEMGRDYIVPVDLHYYDTATGRLAWCRHDRVGAGRVIGRGHLDATDFKPWKPHMDQPDKALHFHDAVYVRDTDILDIKDGENIFSFDAAVGNARESKDVDVSWLAETYPSFDFHPKEEKKSWLKRVLNGRYAT